MKYMKEQLFLYTMLLVVDAYIFAFILFNSDPMSRCMSMHTYESLLKVASYMTGFTSGYSFGMLINIAVTGLRLAYKRTKPEEKRRTAEYEEK